LYQLIIVVCYQVSVVSAAEAGYYDWKVSG